MFNFIKKAYSALLKTPLNFVKNFKNFLATSIAIVLLAAIIFGFFGFNTNFTMSNGHLFKVTFGTELTLEEKESVVNTVKDVLLQNEVHHSRVVVEGEYENNTVVVLIRGSLLNKTGEELQDAFTAISDEIKLEIENDHTFGGLKISDLQKTSPISILSRIGDLAYVIAIIAVAFAVYALIKYEALTALAMIIGALHDVLLFVAVIVLARIEISTFIFLAAVFAFIYSLIVNSINFDAIHTGLQKEKFVKQTNAQMIDKVWKGNISKHAVMGGLTVLVGLVFTAMGSVASLEIGLSLIAVALLVDVTSLVFTPSIWALLYNKENDKRLARRIEAKNNPKDEADDLVV